MPQENPKQITLFEELYHQIENELSRLRGNATSLERIEDLLHVDSKGCTSGPGTPMPEISTLYDKLDSFKTQLIFANNRLENIISHLETVV